MTTPFLKAVAEDLYNKVGGNLSRTAVIFPNKRAGLFFNQWLTECTDRPIWAPVYLTISELFRTLTPLQVSDPIQLVCKLYRIFCQETGEQEETLDNFYFWGEMLIADFDDLDKNCVDADHLFQNLKELHELMDDYSYLTDLQKEALKTFFTNFKLNENTPLKDNFSNLWNCLGRIYHQFRKNLKAEGLAYEGQLYREAIESPDFSQLPYDRYVFVGFNVLNKVEHRLFSTLQAEGKALFYWDYDIHYKANNNHEAGEFIRRNLEVFPNELTDEQLFDNIKRPKKVEFISAPTENIQARYVSEWLKENLTAPENETAVVLCNEQILQPVLHALPEDRINALNITMGYPLSGTPVHNLLTLLIELYTDGYDSRHGKYRYNYVSAVLKHPYIRILSPQAEELEQHLTKNNRFFPHPSELQKDETLSLLFPGIDTISCETCLSLLQQALNLTANLFREENAQLTVDRQLSQEALYKTYTLVNRLACLVESGELTVSLPILARLLKNLANSLSIPFHGEPAIGLQVMGVLETRNLDFKHLLMLSVNEGKLPKKESESSFIPYNLRKAFGMTTIEHKNAVYAYYFYRLIQRAERITLLYNTSSEGLNRGEMSRFMLQYLVEVTADVNRYNLSATQGISRHPDISVKGNTETRQRLLQRFGSKGKYLSPSALNVYLDCPLKFYLRYACQLYETDQVTTEIDNSVFGSIFHRSVELIYKEELGQRGNRLIQKSDIENLLKNDIRIEKIIHRAFNKEFFHIPAEQEAEYNGLQLINRAVITTYVKQLLRRDAEYAPFQYLAAEHDVRRPICIQPDDGSAPFNITLGGSIDRMDKKADRLRIIDYKTGSHIQEAKSMDQLFDKDHKSRPYHLFQTFFYATLMTEEQADAVTPALFYIQKAHSQGYTPIVCLNKEPIENFADYKAEFDAKLKELLTEVFSANTSFNQTTVKDRCKFCEFSGICGR